MEGPLSDPETLGSGGRSEREIDLLHRRLRESEERYRMFVEHAVDAIWCLETPLPIDLTLPVDEQARRWRRFGRVAECNDAFARRIGAATAAEVRTWPLARLAGHWTAAPGDTFERLAESRYAPQDRVFIENDGAERERHIRVSAFGVLGPEIVQRLWVVEQDITRQVAEDRALRDSRDLYEAVIRTALDGICVLDGGFRVIDCNAAFERLLSATRVQLLGRDARTLLAPDERDRLRPNLAGLLRTGGWRGRTQLVRTDGVQRHVEVSVQYTDNRGGRYYCFAQDVTDELAARDAERRREAQLAHISRLSTLGEMTSGIAHELNQPLAAIVNYATGVARRLRGRGEPDEELLRAVDQVANQARRAGSILQRLRAFAQKGDGGIVRTALNPLVEETVGFLGLADPGQRARVTLELSASPDAVLADPILVQQVLANLIRNAEDALGPAALAQGPRIQLWTGPAAEAGFLEVRVTDDGPGVPKDVLPRLFTPFFTTKPSGLGLGLSISASIVQAHGGRLWVVPGPRGGASFRFTLPAPTPRNHV